MRFARTKPVSLIAAVVALAATLTAAAAAEPTVFAGKILAVIGGARDQYGRTVARVDVDGQDVGERLVRDGLAWH